MVVRGLRVVRKGLYCGEEMNCVWWVRDCQSVFKFGVSGPDDRGGGMELDVNGM